MVCGSNSAVSHRFISEKEQTYINDHIENKEKVTNYMTKLSDPILIMTFLCRFTYIDRQR